jgi:transcriptional antiterminator
MSTSKPKSREPLDTRQRSILIAFYHQNPYPSASERQQLVQTTGRTLKQIQDWFSNRRVCLFHLSFYLIMKF